MFFAHRVRDHVQTVQQSISKRKELDATKDAAKAAAAEAERQSEAQQDAMDNSEDDDGLWEDDGANDDDGGTGNTYDGRSTLKRRVTTLEEKLSEWEHGLWRVTTLEQKLSALQKKVLEEFAHRLWCVEQTAGSAERAANSR